MVELSLGITVDPSIRFGKPVIKGTRVPAIQSLRVLPLE